MNTLNPLDGRYQSKVAALVPFFSEQALNGARVEVEIRYFIALSAETGVPELSPVSSSQKKALEAITTGFDAKAQAEVKQFEKTTNHDVKAVEYYLKQKIGRISGLKNAVEFIHFGLTSEDVNNLAYGLLIMRALKQVIVPGMTGVISDLKKLATSGKQVALLSLTHGQPATPTTVGKEVMVFVDRLQRQLDHVRQFTMQGKFGGAVGTYSAHLAAYPKVKWERFGHKFIKSLGLDPLTHTTQINPHDDVAELSHMVSRFNTIGIDLARDVWSYISRGVFKQKVIAGEVGSSTMPHKVNPIDFENAEGNFGLSNALFTHFADKLPISRLQRDLTDSTVQRNIGVAFGYHVLALTSLCKGLGKLSLDKARIRQELQQHPEVVAEAIQTVLRRHGVSGAYEKLKELTRGEQMTTENLSSFIANLAITDAEKDRLQQLLPQG